MIQILFFASGVFFVVRQSAILPRMNTNAIIHHAYDNFCYPLDSSELEISILTGKDVTSVTLVFGDPFLGTVKDGIFEWQGDEVKMTEKKEQ